MKSLQNPILANNLCDDPSVGGDIKSSFGVTAGTSHLENNIDYAPILPVSTKILFGLFEVPSVVYGCVNILLAVYGYVSFVLSYSLRLNRSASLYSIAVQHTAFVIFTFFVVGTWIVIPVAQSLSLFVPRTDIEVTRYIPMSLYNHFFMVANPGFELNPRLPSDIENFGLLRSYAFKQSCAMRGFLAVLLVMYSTSLALDDQSASSSSAYFWYASLFVTVVLNMRITLLCLWFLPRMMSMACSDYFTMRGYIGPVRGTLHYELIMEWWNYMAL
jgi:hypothetical protein